MSGTNAVGEFLQRVGTAQRYDSSFVSFADGSWPQRLQPGSWRGVGFVLDVCATRVGRRVAIHEYPYRDTAWAEDLGKLPRRFAVAAYLVGDYVYEQRDRMIAACEKAGPGTLVHPTLGSVECVLLESEFTDRRDHGRVVEFNLQFIISSDVRYPSTTIASGNAITNAGKALQAAARGDLSSALGSVRSVPAVAADVSGFTGLSTIVASDPTRALRAVTGLAGNFSRFAAGHRSTTFQGTVSSVLADATRLTTGVTRAADEVTRLAALL